MDQKFFFVVSTGNSIFYAILSIMRSDELSLNGVTWSYDLPITQFSDSPMNRVTWSADLPMNGVTRFYDLVNDDLLLNGVNQFEDLPIDIVTLMIN